MSWFTSKAEKEMGPELWAEYKRERKHIPTLGPRGDKDEKRLQQLFLSVARGDAVIVRTYFQWIVTSRLAAKQLQHEANILAKHGYRLAAQTMSPSGALTGGGDHTATFVKESS